MLLVAVAMIVTFTVPAHLTGVTVAIISGILIIGVILIVVLKK